MKGRLTRSILFLLVLGSATALHGCGRLGYDELGNPNGGDGDGDVDGGGIFACASTVQTVAAFVPVRASGQLARQDSPIGNCTPSIAPRFVTAFNIADAGDLQVSLIADSAMTIGFYEGDCTSYAHMRCVEAADGASLHLAEARDSMLIVVTGSAESEGDIVELSLTLL